jgi:hemolysin III
MNEVINQKPLLRGHFHQAMFFVALGGLTPLLLRTTNLNDFISILIYSVCALFLFGTSALYHRINWISSDKRLLFKKLDHSGIYLMIAGSFTPIALKGLPIEKAQTLLFIIWMIALIGIFKSFLFPKLPKIISSLIYISTGYIIFPYLSDLKINLGIDNIILIFLGGLSYIIGALCYGLKWPKLNPAYYGYHEIFHLFVNLGAIIHFIVINKSIN